MTRDRNTYIGSGDAIDLMHGRFRKVWLEKTGRAEREDLTDKFPVQLGIFTERFHVEWLHRRVWATGALPETHTGVAHDQHMRMTGELSFIGATLDAFFGDGVPVEVKHTGGFKPFDQVLAYYMPQLQHHLLVTGAEKLIFSVIMGNREPEWVWVGASAEWHESMIDTYREFWRLIETDTDPGMDSPGVIETLSTDPVPLNGMVARSMVGSNLWKVLEAQYIDNENAAATFEKAKKDLKAMVEADHREVYGERLAIVRDKAGRLRFKAREPVAA